MVEQQSGPPTHLRIEAQPSGEGVVRLALAGEMDLATVEAFTQAVAAVADTAPAVVADLAGVTFLDSAGIGALVAEHRKAAARGQQFTVINAHGTVRRVLALTGVLDVLSA